MAPSLREKIEEKIGYSAVVVHATIIILTCRCAASWKQSMRVIVGGASIKGGIKHISEGVSGNEYVRPNPPIALRSKV
jgi:hypothetical protein